MRVGLATGPVVVGDLIGGGASQESAVVGETPNVVAQVEVLADPGSIFLSETTRHPIGGIFELEDVGAKSLNGIAVQVRVYHAVREAALGSRFEAAHSTILSPLTAREEELGLLLNR